MQDLASVSLQGGSLSFSHMMRKICIGQILIVCHIKAPLYYLHTVASFNVNLREKCLYVFIILKEIYASFWHNFFFLVSKKYASKIPIS